MNNYPNHENEDSSNHHHGNAFASPFFIILGFAAIEFYGGVFTNSLALMGDAGHMLSDALALGLALFASHYSKKISAKNTLAA